jgi:hypothetical protein
MGQERPVDGGGTVSAFHPFATRSVRATNAAPGHKRHFALRQSVIAIIPSERTSAGVHLRSFGSHDASLGQVLPNFRQQ